MKFDLNFFTYSPEKTTLEEKLLTTALIIGFIAAIIGGALNFFLGYSAIAVIIPVVLAFFLLFLLIRLKNRANYSAYLFPIILIAFFGEGIIWIKNGGYDGTNTLIFITTFVLALSVTPQSKFIFLYSYVISILLIIHCIHYFFPGMISSFPNQNVRFIDTIITVLYTTTFIYFLIIFLIKNYRIERALSEERRRKLEVLNEELRISNAAKDKLLSIIAHDLKVPFNTILGFSELSLEQLRKGELQKSENSVKQSIKSAGNSLILLENLLHWANSQNGKMEFQPQYHNLQDIIKEVIEGLEASARIKNISITFFQSDNISVFADKNMLQTILRNLISNAIKFTREQGAVTLYSIHDKSKVEITVEDTGIGITDKHLKSLFAVETHKSTSGTSGESGSGLGLVLCREFIEKHGGTINAESQVGKGSRFIFSLPLPN